MATKSGFYTCVKLDGTKYIWTGQLFETVMVPGARPVTRPVIVGDDNVEEDAKRYKDVRKAMERLHKDNPKTSFASHWREAFKSVTGYYPKLGSKLHFEDGRVA